MSPLAAWGGWGAGGDLAAVFFLHVSKGLNICSSLGLETLTV